MKNAAWSILGIALGFVYVLTTGALSVQVIGQESGAVFDLNNVVVGVTPPRLPIFPFIAIAALGGLVMFCLTVALSALPKRRRLLIVAGFFITVAALIVWAFMLTAGRSAPAESVVGVLEGWQGWLEKGGSNSAVHLVALLSLGSLWLWPDRERAGAQEAATVSSAED